ncbi:MAG TPA: IscS subfamily cysteine desulfurase [Candidatus Avoscillospira stercorigallinarum]|uniref:cysteine desulfurase n=1 Tax=Candidatus Avoscillospira stercorigallinarum TaxID=2840708 RepID=A0A9D0Z5W4_9FIRM|nr:IscS subfamily cysteine desulfurase [Candidatus Avoscillospira stercorigallinarum]
MYVYADNAATTPVHAKAAEAMLACLKEEYGNPSSLHTVGQRAKELLDRARADMAACLGAEAREIYFTGGGSEADNQALLTGAMLGAKKGKKHLITTAFEHHAVLHAMKRLEKLGFTVTYLDVHEDGVVRPEDVAAALTEDTALVSVMLVNNEIGTLQPVAEIAKLCHEKGVLVHTDAVQAVGHIPVDVKALDVDMLSLSGHKFHAPKGVGALYCRKGLRPEILIEGGAQEFGRRGGTENLPGIVAMAAALKETTENLAREMDQVTALREKLIAGLETIPHSRLNGSRTLRCPGTVNFCFEGIEGESLLLLLDAKGVAASSGSACTSGSLDPSHVLLALGLPHEIAHGSLRLSLTADNTEAEVDHILAVVPEVVSYLRSISPVWEALETGKQPHLI